MEINPLTPSRYTSESRETLQKEFLKDFPQGIDLSDRSPKAIGLLQHWKARLVNGDIHRFMLKPGSPHRPNRHWPPRFWATANEEREYGNELRLREGEARLERLRNDTIQQYVADYGRAPEVGQLLWDTEDNLVRCARRTPRIRCTSAKRAQWRT